MCVCVYCGIIILFRSECIGKIVSHIIRRNNLLTCKLEKIYFCLSKMAYRFYLIRSYVQLPRDYNETYNHNWLTPKKYSWIKYLTPKNNMPIYSFEPPNDEGYVVFKPMVIITFEMFQPSLFNLFREVLQFNKLPANSYNT